MTLTSDQRRPLDELPDLGFGASEPSNADRDRRGAVAGQGSYTPSYARVRELAGRNSGRAL